MTIEIEKMHPERYQVLYQKLLQATKLTSIKVVYGAKILKILDDSYEVISANDGKEAIDILDDERKRNDIKAVLLDLNMPNVNGFEVLDFYKNKDLFRSIPISIITGVDDKESINKAFKYPIVDILLKPFNERDVKRILEKTINSNI